MAPQTNPRSASTSPPAPSGVDPLADVRRQLLAARLALYWERLWPRLALVIALIASLLSAVWLGLIAELPDYPRLAFVGMVLLVIAAAAVRAAVTAVPGRRDAIARLEADAGLSHHPLQALTDHPLLGADDPLARSLWQAHCKRLRASLVGLRPRWPSPRLDRADPFALRAAVILATIVGWVAADGQHLSLISQAVSLPVGRVADARVDAWVTPPAYTGEPPRYLQDGASEAIRVPAGSLMTLRVNGVDTPEARYAARTGQDGADTAINRLTPTPVAAQGDSQPVAFEWPLDASGTATLSGDGQVLRRYSFEVIADEPPRIGLIEQPAGTDKGLLRLAYEVFDDHRVAAASALVTLADSPAGARALVAPPELALALPPRGGATTTAVTTRDVSLSPLAGATVALRLQASDDAGQTGVSAPIDMQLPARRFRDPLAAMLVEQRRLLAADARRARSIAATVDSVSALGAPYIDHAAPIIGLRVLTERLRGARSDDELRAVLDFMWSMALAIENGDSSAAEQRLSEAREALRDALARGAGKEEIARLMDEVRKALDDYLKSQAEALARDPERMKELARRQPGEGQSMSREDLDKMLDRLQQLGELGQHEAAEQLMSELDSLLDNMQMMPSGQAGSGEPSETDKALDKLANMIRRQQELMNETHKFTPDGNTPSTNGMDSGQRQGALDGLKKEQQSLADELQGLLDQLGKGEGNGEGQSGKGDFGKALDGMKGAGDQLGGGDAEGAIGQQGDALQALRNGARQMAQGSEGAGGTKPGGTQTGGNDPLGRPSRNRGPDFGTTTQIPGEIEVQQARKLIEELRRRFSDPSRPPLELDYLKRLLGNF